MKNLEQNQEFRLNEILFQNRNKAYGAYVLRNESDRILTKSLVIGVSLLAAFAITPIVINAFKTVEVTEPTFVLPPPIDISDVPEDPPAVTPNQTAPQPPKSVMQYNSQVPTPGKDANESDIVTEIPPKAVAGFKNDFVSPPAEPNVHIVLPANSGSGTVVLPKTVITEDGSGDDAVDNPGILAVSADFVGGIDSFRNKVLNKFDVSSFTEEGSMTTVVTFVVEKDGTISNIKTNGKDAGFNAEAVRTIKAVKGKWIPGKNKKGESVRSLFKFPISMKFDN